MACNHWDCNNITDLGFCKLSACNNSKYNGSGTYTITADVVPRAEYERVKAENEELKRRLEQQLKEIYFKLGKLMDIHLKRETEYEERGEKDMEFYSHARYMGIYDAQFMILEEIKRYAQGEG